MWAITPPLLRILPIISSTNSNRSSSTNPKQQKSLCLPVFHIPQHNNAKAMSAFPGFPGFPPFPGFPGMGSGRSGGGYGGNSGGGRRELDSVTLRRQGDAISNQALSLPSFLLPPYLTSSPLEM